MSDNSGLFRKKALEHISSPEQLDTLLEVLPRRSWLPLVVLGLAIFGVLVWSVVGLGKPLPERIARYVAAISSWASHLRPPRLSHLIIVRAKAKDLS